MKNGDLQKLIDELVGSETGAEMLWNVHDELGAVADFMVDPENKSVAYQLLSPRSVMAYDRIRGFELQDFLVQKDKNRIVFRSKSGVIYILRPAENKSAVNTLTFNPLNDEERDIVRGTLMNYLHSK